MTPSGAAATAAAGAAAELPVARVAVDIPLAHLDRPFDYLVPEQLAGDARPGARVRVRFAGQLVNGFVLDRSAESEHTGRLDRLQRVVSPEPVLTPEVAGLARLVADRYAGTLADVLRLAVPPRHARVEAEEATAAPTSSLAPPDPGTWSRYAGGAAFLAALAEGRSPRAVLSALPGPSWPDELSRAVQATLAGGRGAVVVVPDRRDVDRVDAALAAALGPGRHVALTAELGPPERYRRWLRLLRGGVRAVVGTRAAMFAPVSALGLVVIWDDGDDLHAEPRAPYPHAREVLLLRAHDEGTAALVASFARTAESAQLVATGWARSVVAPREVVRAAAPLVRVAGDDAGLARDAAAHSARLPSIAWQVAHDALAHGPVLVQVPRRGYVPRLSCDRCRAPARCPHCAGPLALTSGQAVASCRWCGRPARGWRCRECDGARFRAAVVGSQRTAEELGRAFPAMPVRTSGGGNVLPFVRPEPALVVATPGAEPVAPDGYAAALLLDSWALLDRPDLRAGEEALRRWMAAAALVRPAGEGGTVVVLADNAIAPVQALLRWDPVTFAERELADRSALGFPPAARVAALTGAEADVLDLLGALHAGALPSRAEILGPVPAHAGSPPFASGEANGPPPVRALVRTPRGDGPALARAIHGALGVRTARKAGGPVRVEIDPRELG
ncbi:MAG TPA: primosomal protein N' [Chloroflexota bacterium]|nr:primosomal protein N' [Chloroflexota bacterium]